MAISPYKESKLISSEISESNILNYKRRSSLVSTLYHKDKDKFVIDSIKTLTNCYDKLYDLKNFISD